MQFYKGIGLWDVLIGGIALGFIALAMTSNLPNNYVISLVILIITAPLFIPIGEIKVYHAIGYGLRFLIADKKFSRRDKGKKNIGAIVPYANIRDNVILQKDGIYTGVIQITPIEFNMLSLNKQNYLIDGVISNTLKNVGVFQEYNLFVFQLFQLLIHLKLLNSFHKMMFLNLYIFLEL